MRRACLWLCTGLVVSFNALAATPDKPNWKLLDTLQDNTRLYIDEGRLVRKGAMASAWVLYDGPGDPVPDENWRSIVLHVEIDCAAQAMRHVGNDAYEGNMAQGRVVRSRLLENQMFRPPTPGSSSRRIVEHACG